MLLTMKGNLCVSDYDPFFIDFNNQFNIIGRVVGLMRPVI